MKNPIQIVVGAQAGSEAKGHYIEHVADQFDMAVRTGAPNAGHTVYYKDKPYAMQIIPCTWINPKCKLVIGAGALIDLEQLSKEIQWIIDAMGRDNLTGRLFIDDNAGILSQKYVEEEIQSDLHNKIGSTAHGCGTALIDRIRREGGFETFSKSDYAHKHSTFFTTCDTARLINDAYDRGSKILLEGTQGSALSLLHSGNYPKCTSRDTNAANWCMEAGLSPALDYEVVLIARSYPIRVAGDSGDLGDEISWCDLYIERLKSEIDSLKSSDIDSKTEIEKEIEEVHSLKAIEREYFDKAESGEIKATMAHRTMFADHPWTEEVFGKINEAFSCITTVTKKVRRVFEFSDELYERAEMLNRPEFVVLQFLNYVFPEVERCESFSDLKLLPRWNKILTYLAALPFYDKLRYIGVNKNVLIAFDRENTKTQQLPL